MPTSVAIYQPRYFPRLHYLARVRQADVFVVYDDVEFSRRSRQHRAPIDFRDSTWLTVPVAHTGREVQIRNAPLDLSTPWLLDHVETLSHKYGAAAEELAGYYYDLLPDVPDPTALQDAASSIRDDLEPETLRHLDECLAHHERWQQRKERLTVLEARKDEVGERIGRARADGRTERAEELIDFCGELSARIDPLETACSRSKRWRDRGLIHLADRLPPNLGLERMEPAALWDLEGVDVDEIVDARLVDLTVPLLIDLLERFDVDTRIVRSSAIDVDHPGDASAYLARLTDAVGGDVYISGETGYENYVDEAPFEAEGVGVTIQDWEPPRETGNVCALDALFDAARPETYLREQRATAP